MQPRWDNDNNDNNNDNDNAQPQLQTTLPALTIFIDQQHTHITQLYNQYVQRYNAPLQGNAILYNQHALYYNELQHIMTPLLSDFTTLYDNYRHNHPWPPPARVWDSPVQTPLQHYSPLLPPNLPTLQRPLQRPLHLLIPPRHPLHLLVLTLL